jgi:hypothetical protein
MNSKLPEIRFITSSLAPVWHVVSASDALKRPELSFFELLQELVKQTLLPKHVYGADFRGMSIDKLPFVLKHGIDVEPTNSVIYVDCYDKALEYGGWPKLGGVKNQVQHVNGS